MAEAVEKLFWLRSDARLILVAPLRSNNDSSNSRLGIECCAITYTCRVFQQPRLKTDIPSLPGEVLFAPKSEHSELSNWAAIRANIQAVLKSVRDYFGTVVVTDTRLWSLPPTIFQRAVLRRVEIKDFFALPSPHSSGPVPDFTAYDTLGVSAEAPPRRVWMFFVPAYSRTRPRSIGKALVSFYKFEGLIFRGKIGKTMSAFGGKADIGGVGPECLLIARSGRTSASFQMAVFKAKRMRNNLTFK